ncbi:MAG: AI-2E family transporter [Nocardioides sp.]
MPTARLPRVVLVLLVGASLVITLAGVRATSGILGPVFLALVLTITVHPVRGWLSRRGLPDWLASVAAVLAVYLLIVLLAIALVVSVAQLATVLPSYGPKIQDHLSSATSWLGDRGVGTSQIDTMIQSLDVGKIVDILTTVLARVLSLLTNLFFIATMVFFLAFDTTSSNRILDQIRPHRPHLIDALRNFAIGTRNYMGVSTVFGFVVAVIDGAALWMLGVDGWFVWGVLAFVTNYIPNVGFVIGVVPPALLGFLDSGLSTLIWVIAVYSAVNVVVQTIIQPRIVGDKVGLSATVTFLSLVFWAWALGALGALLAVPLTLLVRALLVEADPDARWALPLITGKPADEVPPALAP